MATKSSLTCSTPSSSGSSLSSNDTSHSAVQTFRQNVLAPYRIRVYDAPSKQALPQRLLRLIDDLSQNLTQFDYQLDLFKERLNSRNDFSCANLVSTDLLPTFSYETRLTRSLGPLFSRQALPQQACLQGVRSYSPSIPRANFACGFSRSAFSLSELSSMPPALTCQGLVEDGTTSPTSPINTTFYGSFLSFQQAYGFSEVGLEAARHQCAINGACNVRALQMVGPLTDQKMGTVLRPQAFSCCVNRESAVINHHWMDKNQNYCMAPICRFELLNDDHFRLLMAWIGAIERWAVIELLPQIKGALGHIPEMMLSPPSTPEDDPAVTASPSLRNGGNCNLLLHSLKTKIEALPCQPENGGDDESDSLSPSSNSDRKTCSSATASWDSFTPTLLALPKLPLTKPARTPAKTTATESKKKSDRQRSLDRLRQRRINHAMNEVQEIETQLRNVRKETRDLIRSLQSEMKKLRQVHEALEDELLGAKQRVCAIENEIFCGTATADSFHSFEPVVKAFEKSIEGPCSNLPTQQARSTTIPIRLGVKNTHVAGADLISAQPQQHQERILPALDMKSHLSGLSTYPSICAPSISPRAHLKPMQMHRLPRLQTVLNTSVLKANISTSVQPYPSSATYRNHSSVPMPVAHIDISPILSSATFSPLFAPTPPQTQEIPYPTTTALNPIDADTLIERLLMLPPTPHIPTPPSPATTILSECFSDSDSDDSIHHPVYFGLGIDIPEINSMESATAELLSVYSDDDSDEHLTLNVKPNNDDDNETNNTDHSNPLLTYLVASLATSVLFNQSSILTFAAQILVFMLLLKILATSGSPTLKHNP